MHDQTAVRTEGIDGLLDQYTGVKVLVDSSYRGLANDHPNQVIAPPRKPKQGAPAGEVGAYQAAGKAQSSHRIPAEHAIAELKWWRQLQRFTGRRDVLPELIQAVTSLVCDRAAARNANPPPRSTTHAVNRSQGGSSSVSYVTLDACTWTS
jgi:hypothetical protein